MTRWLTTAALIIGALGGALGFVTVGSTAEAAPPASYQADVIGSGTISCGTWTAWRRSGQAAHAEQWILGFLSGIGYEGVGDPLNGVDANAVWAWMDNYCQANPLDAIVKAGAAFNAAHPRGEYPHPR